MKIIGNLDKDLAEHYANLLEQEVLNTTPGSSCIIAFTGIHAIKYPQEHLNDNGFREKLIQEYNIGKGLEKIGLNVPKMQGVIIESQFDSPFLVMDALSIIKPHLISKNERKEAKKQHIKQIQIARNNGYVPYDAYCESTNKDYRVSHDANWGYNKKQNKIYLFDFTDWRKN